SSQFHPESRSRRKAAAGPKEVPTEGSSHQARSSAISMPSPPVLSRRCRPLRGGRRLPRLPELVAAGDRLAEAIDLRADGGRGQRAVVENAARVELLLAATVRLGDEESNGRDAAVR